MLAALAAGAVALAALAACSSRGSDASRAGAPVTTAGATAAVPPAPPAATPSTPGSPVSAPPHLMVIVLENREYDEVIGNRSAPFLNQLAARYGMATGLFARTHPSLPNYLDLLAGTTFGITSDCTSCTVEGDTFVDQLQRAGVSWGAFMEGMPSPCFTGAGAGRYAKKHNPFVYVRHLVADPAMCAKVEPHDRLSAALDGPDPPAFVWVTPDLCQDGHDCPIGTVDTWLRGEVDAVQASGWYRAGGTIIVTWDEGSSKAGCCGPARGGHIATFVVAEGVTPGARLDAPVSQAGILATLEDAYRVPRLREAADPASGSLAPLLPSPLRTGGR